MDAVLAYYAEDAVETNGEGTFTGHDELREVLDRVIRHFTMDCDNYQVGGNKYSCKNNFPTFCVFGQTKRGKKNGTCFYTTAKVTYDCLLKGRKDPNPVLWGVERYDAVLNEEGKLQTNILIETFKP